MAEPAIPKRRISYLVAPGYAFAWLDTPSDFRIKQDCGCSGLTVNANVGYRRDENMTVGGHLGVGWITGRYGIDFGDHIYPIRFIPIDLAISLGINEYKRYWATLFAGLHVSHATEPATTAPHVGTVWDVGLAIGLQLGADIVEFGDHKVGIHARFNGALGTTNGFGGVSLGLAYRY